MPAKLNSGLLDNPYNEGLTEVSKANPCPHCGKSDWCYTIKNDSGIRSVCNRDFKPATGWAETGVYDSNGKELYKPDQPKEKQSPQSKQLKPRVKTPTHSPVPIPKGVKLLTADNLGDTPPTELLTSTPPHGVPSNATRTIYQYSDNQWVYRYQWDDSSKEKGYAKTFRQYHRGSDGEIKAKKGTRPWKPYRLEEVLAHINNVEVTALLWGEGEKCVEIARAECIISITLQGSNWSQKAIVEGLKLISEASPRCTQVYIADSDNTGEKKAEKFKKACNEVGLPCLIIYPKLIFGVEGDIEEILESMDTPEFIKKLEEELHAAAAVKEEFEGIDAPDFSADLLITEGEKSFIHDAIEFFFGSNPWICVDGRLYEWKTNYYSEVPDEYLISKIQQYCNNFPVFDCGKVSYPYATTRAASEVLKMQKNLGTIPEEEVNPPGINCTNGVLKIQWEGNVPSPQLINHNPMHYYTYPPLVEYNPEADPTQCNKLLECLDPAQQEVFLRNVAASIDLPKVRKIRGREVKVLLLSGLGSNGKDSLREVVSTIWGHKGMTSCSLADFAAYDDGRKFSLAALRGSRINWASENPQTGRIDKIQSLKLFATGNKLHAERKGKDHVEFTPEATGFFNVNEAPSLQGTLQAIIDRIGVLQFRKTYKKNPDPGNPNELLADPRFAYDEEFIQTEVAPAFLNRMLQALEDLCREGINYECTMGAFKDMQRAGNHLFQFCDDVGLAEDSNGVMSAVELFELLEGWYKDNGTLTIGDHGKKLWCEQAKPSDKNVKGSNQIIPRLLQIFPKASKVTMPHPTFGVKRRISALKGVSIQKPKNNQTIENSTPINENSTPSAHPVSTPSFPCTARVAHPAHPVESIVGEKNQKVDKKVSLTENFDQKIDQVEESPPRSGCGGCATLENTSLLGVQSECAVGVPFSTMGVPFSTNSEKPESTNEADKKVVTDTACEVTERSIRSGDIVFPIAGKYQGKECVVGTVDGNRYWVRPVNAVKGSGYPIFCQTHELSFDSPQVANIQTPEEEEVMELFNYAKNLELDEYLHDPEDEF